MSIPFYLVDTFTSTRLKGNPTPVIVHGPDFDDAQMHAIARELNLPVTTFVNFKKGKEAHGLRYFTVTGEIPACGHATLAAAKLIFDLTGEMTARFRTIENIIIGARLETDIIFMHYPRYKTIDFQISEALLKSLGIRGYETVSFSMELQSLFIGLKTAEELRGLQPDYVSMIKSPDAIKEVVVFSTSDQHDYDFLLRSFCPWIGINEDPVTGSVHSVLAHLWEGRLGKKNLVAYQASERGGEVHLNVLENAVEIGGKTAMVIKGDIFKWVQIGSSTMKIQNNRPERASEKDFQEITELWEASVRATHHFLSEENIQYFKPLVLNEFLSTVNLYCTRDEAGRITGFLGTANDKIEMLFIHPSQMGKGLGKKLLWYAIDELKMSKVDVNEQNEQAVLFYLHSGFVISDRSELDGLEKPFPILHLELK